MTYVFKLRYKNTKTKHHFTINTTVIVPVNHGHESDLYTAWTKALARGTGLAAVENNIYLHEITLLFVRR